MRNLSAHHRYHFIRATAHGCCGNEGESTENIRYDVIDINDISSHIEMFKKHVPYIEPSYTVHTQARNADASIITALGESKCYLNLNSISDVRVVAGILGDHARIKQLCCYSSLAKSRLHIVEAMRVGINRMTVSYPAEVLRIASVSKNIELVLQVAPSRSDIHEKESAAQREKQMVIMEMAKLKEMKITGIALGGGTITEHTNEKERISQALSNLRDAYDLASTMGHDVSFVDLGTIISNFSQYNQSARQQCSTIIEELGVEDTLSNWDLDQHISELDQKSEDEFLSLFRLYLPDSLGAELQVFAQHAHYFVPDHNDILKWWGTPKARRSAPSLHSYLAGGCNSSGKSLNKSPYLAYRSRKQTMTSSNILNENPPAAAQA